jgi:hypothetical protein
LILALLNELPTLWATAQDLADCTGISRVCAARTALRLAKTGAIAHRETTWRSSRSRTRRRAEFAYLPSDDPFRQALPVWLEPVAHPVNQACCRRVVGKMQHLFDKEQPMTEHEIYELPVGVRERFKQIPDDAFDDHPEVEAARNRLAEFEAAHLALVAKSHRVRTNIAEQEARRDASRLESLRLNDLRPRQIADMLLAGGDLSEDLKAVEEIERLQHFATALDLAKPHLERVFQKANEETRYVVSQIEGETDHLRGLLDSLKLAEAKRQTYA